MRRWVVLALLGIGVGPLAFAGAKPCVSAEQAGAMLHKDVSSRGMCTTLWNCRTGRAISTSVRPT